MKFTTPVSIIPQEPKIDHHSKIFLTGSCFVENIGDKFDYFKIPNKRNPFGILYHPFAILELISRAVSGSTFSAEDVFFHNERWHCFYAHSSLSDPDRDKLINRLNEELVSTREYIMEATHVILTPGTSWIYRRVENDAAVANCHKLPNAHFNKEISGVAELEEAFQNIVSLIRKLNSSAPIIFTISPVRHIKDGMVENQLSKSQLFVAVHNSLTGQNLTSYFPSYEIMMDELRDYRFYAEDMLHPGNIGTEFIWNKFVYAWFSPGATLLLQEIDSIQKALAHKPFHEESVAHQKFKMDLQFKISNVKNQFPHLSF